MRRNARWLIVQMLTEAFPRKVEWAKSPFSVAEAAANIGTGHAYLVRVASGETSPSLQSIENIARGCGRHVEYDQDGDDLVIRLVR